MATGSVSVRQAIAEAESILPGRAAPQGETDPRWQAIIKIADFIPHEPEAIWEFAARWGADEDEDLRDAVATLLLEHLLGEHFERYFPKVEMAARENKSFADTFRRCRKFGQAKQQENAERFDRLQKECRDRAKK